jgi:hypothetical protein
VQGLQGPLQNASFFAAKGVNLAEVLRMHGVEFALQEALRPVREHDVGVWMTGAEVRHEPGTGFA